MNEIAPVTLSVFFEGTANPLQPITTQVGVFFDSAIATDISDSSTVLAVSDLAGRHLKMGFDGCGVVAGIAGVIWAFGLGPQCDAVVQRAKAILDAHPPVMLRLNVLGLSRGGIAALMLAQRCAKLEGLERLSLSLCLYDPVPGNLVVTTKFCDPFGMSVANSVLDVSRCPIARALAIYPYEPLPDAAFHAPLLPTYPDACEVEEDATLGCHQGALCAPCLHTA